MKVFDLLCAMGHQFEGWFATEEDYQKQREHSLLACPVCGSEEVSKMLSAPRLQRKSNQKTGSTAVSVPQAEQSPAPQTSLPGIQAKLENEILNYIIKNTEDVGEHFAEEARKIHYGEVDGRNIRGQTTGQEAHELLEEGIDIVQLPFLPSSKKHLQ